MTTITLILTQGYADWEGALLGAVARSFYGMTTRWVTPDGAPVTSSGGLTVAPDGPLTGIGETDALVVLGGRAWRAPDTPDVAGALAWAAETGRVVAGICDGTRALASAGLLDRVAHTANDADTLDVAGYAGAARFRASPVALRDRNIVTAPGTAPVSFMAEVMAALGRADANLAHWRGMLAAEHRDARRAA
jgi:transcriptional regulator GlxA family with amidase domain